MHSHTSTVINGYSEYIQEVSRDQCNKMNKTGVFHVSLNTQITGLKINRTSSHAIMLAGSTQVNGQYPGSQYSDLFGTWENVIVHGEKSALLTRARDTIQPCSLLNMALDLYCQRADTAHAFPRTEQPCTGHAMLFHSRTVCRHGRAVSKYLYAARATIFMKISSHLNYITY